MKIQRFFVKLPRIMTYYVLFTALFSLPHSTLWADIYIVGNQNISATSMSPDDVQDIFLGKKTRLADNSNVTFVIQKSGETHKEFLKLYIKRTESQFKNHWKRMLFTGKGSIPKSFESDNALLDYISKNEGMIGYVSKKPQSGNIKIIHVE